MLPEAGHVLAGLLLPFDVLPDPSPDGEAPERLLRSEKLMVGDLTALLNVAIDALGHATGPQEVVDVLKIALILSVRLRLLIRTRVDKKVLPMVAANVGEIIRLGRNDQL